MGAHPASSSAPAAGSAIAGLSPSEAVLLFGDRLILSHDKSAWSDVRIPLSGRYVDLEILAFEAFCALLGALELELSVRSRKGIVWSSEALMVTQRQSPREWPAGSPESRIGAWLAGRPGGEAWLDDLVIDGVRPIPSGLHDRAFNYFAHGLVERGVLKVEKRRTMLIFTRGEYEVAEPWLSELRTASASDVEECLLAARLLDAGTRAKCRPVWERGLLARPDHGYY